MEYAIEPMKFFFRKSCYATYVPRIEECVDFNVHYM